MNLANKITMSRIVMVPFFLIVYLGAFFEEPLKSRIALVIFVIASATDWLDGYIARSRNMTTNFGKFADPLADKLLVAAARVCMVEKGLIPSWPVILIFSREFIILGLRAVAAAENIVIAASWWGKIKTVLQMAMIIFIMAEFKGAWAEIVSTALVWLASLFTVISAIDYIYKNRGVLK